MSDPKSESAKRLARPAKFTGFAKYIGALPLTGTGVMGSTLKSAPYNPFEIFQADVDGFKTSGFSKALPVLEPIQDVLHWMEESRRTWHVFVSSSSRIELQYLGLVNAYAALRSDHSTLAQKVAYLSAQVRALAEPTDLPLPMGPPVDSLVERVRRWCRANLAELSRHEGEMLAIDPRIGIAFAAASSADMSAWLETQPEELAKELFVAHSSQLPR